MAIGKLSTKREKRCASGRSSLAKSLASRTLLSPIQAGGLQAVFKVLANDTRLRLLHSLIRSEELCVNELANTLGMRPQAISNQLQRLSDLGILASRRDGNNIYYRIINGCIAPLLDLALCLTEAECCDD